MTTIPDYNKCIKTSMAAKCVVFQWRSPQDFEAVFQAGVLYSYAMIFKPYILKKISYY